MKKHQKKYNFKNASDIISIFDSYSQKESEDALLFQVNKKENSF